MSYAFDLGDQDDLSAVEDPLDSDAEDDLSEKVLCPLADMLNADNRLCNAKLVMSGGSLIMAAYEEIAPGEQIYNTYGVLPSADLLRRYGYVEQGENLVDTAEIGGDLIAKEVAVVQGDALEKRIDYLLQQELDDEFEIPVNGKLPSEMIAFTEMLMLSDKSFALLVEGNGLTTGSKTPAMQPAMLRILRARLAMFATTVAEDEAILQRGELSSNMRNIVRVRLSEKRILQKAVGLVEEWTFKRSQVDEREANAKRRKA
jgi:SET domain-containing protein 6